jgi:hypothetical protein
MLLRLALLLLAAADDKPFPLSVHVGESVAICATGTIQCPAAAPICDDTSVATAENTDAGLVFKGVKPGSTLCSAASASGAGHRRVYQITVAPDEKIQR